MTDELKPRPQEGEDEFSFGYNAALVEWELKRGCDLVLRAPCGDEWVIPSDEGALDVWNARPEPSVQEAVRDLIEAATDLGLREIVAGWNGEGLERRYKPHPPHLSARIKTTCGVVYRIDAALRAIAEKGGE